MEGMFIFKAISVVSVLLTGLWFASIMCDIGKDLISRILLRLWDKLARWNFLQTGRQ